MRKLGLNGKTLRREVRKLKRLMLILSLCILLSVVGTGISAAIGTGISLEAAEGCQSGIAVKLGYFMPSDDDVSDFYGSGSILGADYLFTSPQESFGFRVGIERFFRTRTTRIFGLSIKQNWSVVPVTGTFVYFPAPEKNFYIGGGLGLYSVREKIKIGWISASVSEMALGFHLVGGYSMCNFFGEAKISHAVVDDINAGGLSMLVGYRLKI